MKSRPLVPQPCPVAFSFRHFASMALLLHLASGVLTTRVAGEPLGPSSRRSGLVISEIMYHPLARADGRNLEFIELYNSEAVPADLSGFRLSGDADFTFPANTTIPALGFLVVAPAPADLQAVWGLSAVLGPFGNPTNSLPNDAGTLRLRNRAGAVLLEIHYSDQPPWPAAADGAGHSLVLARPSLGEADPHAWAPSLRINGSPGALEPADTDPLSAVLINEFLAHTDDPQVDYLELYNHSNQSVDLSGCTLSDEPATNKFTFPPATSLGPRAFLYLTQTNLNFALSAAGETLYFKNPAGDRVLDAVRFGGQQNGVASGRFPDGAPEFYRLSAPTPGLPNAAIRLSDIVLNELMYHPLSEDAADQYVELYNRSGSALDLGGWRLEGALRFTFPSNTLIAADAYLVVAKDAARLMSNYPNLTPANTLGDFEGKLSGSGERLALTMPDTIVVTNSSGLVQTNTIHIIVEELSYRTGGRWGAWSDGGGSSLERIDPRSNPRLASNWADSDESAKAPWTNLEITGTLDLGNNGYAINNLQVILQDAGECLIDDVEVIGPGGTNRIANWNFETNSSGWFFQGTHSQSGWQAGGYNGSAGCLHIRASGKGDTGANRVRCPLLTSLSPGQTATLRAKVRWLRGRPEILLRVHGNYLELAGRMAPPAQPGTPGARNSRAAANNAPAIHSVTHSPALPPANQPVVVTARAEDPDGIASLQLWYRKDPSTSYSSLAMVDDGTGADAVAGDGVFSATIPAQTNTSLIAYYLQAADPGGATSLFPADAPRRECLVRFGEFVPGNKFGTYRIWMTQATFSRWTAREKLSNDPLDVTFVYGNDRVVYNVGALFSGSPFHSPSYTSPTGNPCDYTFLFPADDLWLGSTDVHISWPGNGGDDSTGQREQAAYWIAGQLGLPFNYRRFINLYVNGTKRSYIMEDTQRANADVLNQWYPDDANGDLAKVSGWFEFDDSASSFNAVWATLQNFTTLDPVTGQRVKKPGRYRWNWEKRAVQNSADDFTNLFNLVDAVNTPGTAYVSQVERLVDVDQWMRTFAVEHLVGNWDSYGNRNGQNMYAYKPEHDTWKLLIWDLDIALGGIADGATSSLFAVSDNVILRMYNAPEFRRVYWRAMRDAVNGPLNSTNANAMLDTKYAAFQANGIAAGSPAGIKSYIASRRTSVLSQLNAVAANFALTSNGGVDFSTSSNLLTLTGTAPIDVAAIEVNGVRYAPTWTAVTAWSLVIPLKDGLNPLWVQGFDSRGNPLPGATATFNVTFTGSNDPPTGRLVINEIMYHPAVSGAAFVEIHNTSPTTPYDLSGWRLDGAAFTFPGGSIISPGGFLVVANDVDAFAATYGRLIPLAGVFPGRLSNSGGTLRLVLPGATPADDLVIDQVTYGDTSPWPALADGSGPSLQLIDPTQDNARVANWTAVDTALDSARAPYTPGATNSVFAGLPAYPPLWINEVQPNNDGATRDSFGDADPWLELYNAGTNRVDLAGYYLTGDYALPGLWPFPPQATIGGGEFLRIWADGEPAQSSATEWHTGFRLASDGGSLALTGPVGDQLVVIDYLNYGSVPAGRSLGRFPDGDDNGWLNCYYPTPGARNDNSPGPYTVFINEWMAANTNALADPADGRFDDWFELYNPNSTAIDLTGYTLTDNPTNLVRSVIPPGTTLAPHGHLLVWADKETDQNNPTNADLHAGFKLDKDGDGIALFAPDGTLVDQVDFGPQSENVSQGRWPDGGTDIYFMSTPTPRAPNVIPTNPPPAIQILLADASPDGYFALTWRAEAGKLYRVEYKDDIGASNWVGLPGEIFSYGDTASKADPQPLIGSVRFYRVVRVP